MSSEVAAAYADLLSRERWQWFCTLTFRPDHQRASGGIHPEKADKAFRYFVRRLNEAMYGKRWMATKHGGVIWARGMELHANGRPHFHALFSAPDCNLNDRVQRYAWHEFWYREWGRNQIEEPRSYEDVRAYVSKYVTKDGEVDFSHNFGAVPIPALEWPDCDSGSSAVKPLLTASGIGRSRGEPLRHPEGSGLSLTPPARLQFAHADFQKPNRHAEELDDESDDQEHIR